MSTRHPLALTLILAALTACTLPTSQRAEPALLLAADDPPDGVISAAAGHTCTIMAQIDGTPRRMNCSDLAAYMPTLGGATSTPLPATPKPTLEATPTTAPTAQPPASTLTTVPAVTAAPSLTVVATSVVTATVMTQTDAAKWNIPDYPEVRLQNAMANATSGRAFPKGTRSRSDLPDAYLAKIDGNFVGTTEQILEWAARKWFADQDPDIFKAQAVKESNWDQANRGDFESGAWRSFGILQTKMYSWCAEDAGPNGSATAVPGCEQIHTSTAFAADVAAAVMRAHYDGVMYTGENASWNTYPIQPSVPNPTRFRRAVNAWFQGSGATDGGTDGAGSEYTSIVLGGKVDDPGTQLDGQTLSGELADKRWKRGGF